MTSKKVRAEHLAIHRAINCIGKNGAVDIAKAREKARHASIAIKTALLELRYAEARNETPVIEFVG